MRPDQESSIRQSAITLRMVAALRPSRLDRASVRDPTGSPVAINVSTMAVRISRSDLPLVLEAYFSNLEPEASA